MNRNAPHGGGDIAAQIRRLAQGRSTLDVAQFQFIGLDGIRESYGDRWAAKSERATSISQGFLRKRMTPSDVLIPTTDGYLVIFGHRTGEQAAEAARQITEDLNAFFLGSAEDKDLSLDSDLEQRPVDELTGAFGDVVVDLPAAPPPPPAPVGPALPDTTFSYQPMWDCRREALTMSTITPIDSKTGERVRGYNFDGPLALHRTVDLDEMQLRESETAIQTMLANGRKGLVNVSLHVASLSSPHNLARLLAVLGSFDRDLARFRIVRIAGAEPGFPRSRLEDLTRRLKARAPNVAFSIHWNEPDLAAMLRLGPCAVNLPIPDEVFQPGAARIDLAGRIKAAVAATRPAQIPVCVEGRLSPDLATRLKAAGVAAIASPLVWPMAPEPVSATPWPAMKLVNLVHGMNAA